MGVLSSQALFQTFVVDSGAAVQYAGTASRRGIPCRTPAARARTSAPSLTARRPCADSWTQTLNSFSVEYYFDADTSAPVEVVLSGGGRAHTYAWTSFSFAPVGALLFLPDHCSSAAEVDPSGMFDATVAPGVRTTASLCSAPRA